MSEAHAPPSPQSRWQRFIDKLAGGPPNIEKLEKLKGKRWFVRYNVTLFMVVFSFAIGVAPEIVNQLNGVPDPAALQTLQVRIIRTHVTEPHLFVELPDGRQRGMEWPVGISFHGGFRSYVWTDDERQRLPECLATVQGVPLRWTVNDRFRVWELGCSAQSIRIELDKSIRARKIEEGFLDHFLVFISGWYLFVFVIYLREKRGTL